MYFRAKILPESRTTFNKNDITGEIKEQTPRIQETNYHIYIKQVKVYKMMCILSEFLYIR